MLIQSASSADLLLAPKGGGSQPCPQHGHPELHLLGMGASQSACCGGITYFRPSVGIPIHKDDEMPYSPGTKGRDFLKLGDGGGAAPPGGEFGPSGYHKSV